MVGFCASTAPLLWLTSDAVKGKEFGRVYIALGAILRIVRRFAIAIGRDGRVVEGARLERV